MFFTATSAEQNSPFLTATTRSWLPPFYLLTFLLLKGFFSFLSFLQCSVDLQPRACLPLHHTSHHGSPFGATLLLLEAPGGLRLSTLSPSPSAGTSWEDGDSKSSAFQFLSHVKPFELG